MATNPTGHIKKVPSRSKIKGQMKSDTGKVIKSYERQQKIIEKRRKEQKK